jgi:hypothetical protein
MGDARLPVDVPQSDIQISRKAGSAGALERLEVANGPERWLGLITERRSDLDLDSGGALLSTWAALMEGAIRSGRRAARALLASPSGAKA